MMVDIEAAHSATGVRVAPPLIIFLAHSRGAARNAKELPGGARVRVGAVPLEEE